MPGILDAFWALPVVIGSSRLFVESTSHLLELAHLTGVKTLATFHHDPSHTDEMLDGMHDWLEARADGLGIIRGRPEVLIEL